MTVGNRYFTREVENFIKDEIAKSNGNEVFFVGNIDNNDRIVNEVRVISRGNKYSVPAIVESAVFEQVVIHNHPSGNLTPSEPDIEIASMFGNNGVGFYIIDNNITDIYVVVEPFQKKEYSELNIDDLTGLFSENGVISKALGRKYEYREEQISAMKKFAESFNDESIAIVEAGTGTGKTLSYLIPSIYWSVLNNERVVVSTNTINLQEQLVGKDIPLLQDVLDKKFSFTLVKGMKNYLCLLRLDTMNEGLFELADSADEESLKSIREWAGSTKDGSLSDLSFIPPNDLWDKVSAESESCLRVKCPHYNDCFYFKARREMTRAQIIVANHHMFFSDLSIKSASNDNDAGIIPSYNRVVFDEAHNIVDAATSHFSLRVTKHGLLRTLRRLMTTGSKGEPKGLIFYAASKVANLPDKLQNTALSQALLKTEEVFSPRVPVIEELVRDSFDSLYDFIHSASGDSINGDINIRITERLTSSANWNEIENKYRKVIKDMTSLTGELGSFVVILEQFETETDLSKLLAEFRGIYNRLSYYTEVFETFFYSREESNVRWFEGRQGKSDIVAGLGVSPIEISDVMNSHLYGRCKTVLMTSATLSVNNRFEFQKQQLGLENIKRLSELIVDSTFNYREQTLLAIPDIAEPSEMNYREDLFNFILEAITLSDGHALVLFTSYSFLNDIYDKVSGEYTDQNIMMLKQGMLPRNKLLEKFRKNKESVLFATSSFWEGVDISGDSLRLLIITRLPFRVPTDPMIEARAEYLEKQGINSFMKYSLPLAVLKFKQGFGRLIRSRNDAGVVAVLDSRLYRKRYGRNFLNSLPECDISTGNRFEVLKDLSKFLSKRFGVQTL